jgi:hypothetical protein
LCFIACDWERGSETQHLFECPVESEALDLVREALWAAQKAEGGRGFEKERGRG